MKDQGIGEENSLEFVTPQLIQKNSLPLSEEIIMEKNNTTKIAQPQPGTPATGAVDGVIVTDVNITYHCISLSEKYTDIHFLNEQNP